MASYVNDFCETVRLYYNDLKKYKPLSKEEEKKMISLAKRNNLWARDKVLTSNLKFVFDVARKYRGCGVSMPDLISEGNIGLTKAIERFDETRGVKFISYAVWWIKQSILEYINKSNKRKDYEVDEDDMNSSRSSTVTDEQREDVMSDTLTETEEVPEDDVENTEEKVYTLLQTLTDREQQIVKLYYGIGDDNKEHNLEEIGSEMGISKERVRQIKKKALRKLRTEVLINEESFSFV